MLRDFIFVWKSSIYHCVEHKRNLHNCIEHKRNLHNCQFSRIDWSSMQPLLSFPSSLPEDKILSDSLSFQIRVVYIKEERKTEPGVWGWSRALRMRCKINPFIFLIIKISSTEMFRKHWFVSIDFCTKAIKIIVIDRAIRHKDTCQSIVSLLFVNKNLLWSENWNWWRKLSTLDTHFLPKLIK